MCKFETDPKESHLMAVRHIIRYVNGKLDHGILYSMDSNLDLVSYSYVNLAGNADDKKNIYGGCFYIGSNL